MGLGSWRGKFNEHVVVAWTMTATENVHQPGCSVIVCVCVNVCVYVCVSVGVCLCVCVPVSVCWSVHVF